MRLFREEPKSSGDTSYRTEWRRDYARVIHSASFRRLQGKTQLFYGNESIFRNRLTHSLEVAQIAKTIALKLNHEYNLGINPDICEIAGLVHDLGHPPFGHNGEAALDDCMRKYGGFEGNAQTMRILCRLEKRRKGEGIGSSGIGPQGEDGRYGANLTSRSLAAALKYDRIIPATRNDKEPLVKGYYQSEQEAIDLVKKNVLNGHILSDDLFRTVECAIMDLADDIAYSTYDLEDAWKAGFVQPIDLIAVSRRKLTRIADKVRRADGLKGYDDDLVREALKNLVAGDFSQMLTEAEDILESDRMATVGAVYLDSNQLANSGYRRTAFTSNLIEKLISGIEVVEHDIPAMTRVRFDDPTLFMVEVLKQYSYASIIESPRLRIPEFRGYDVVRKIFDAIADEDKHGYNLLPEDFRETYEALPETSVAHRKRVIADFVAGMTDRYAMQFFNRLTADSPSTIFGPSL